MRTEQDVIAGVTSLHVMYHGVGSEVFYDNVRIELAFRHGGTQLVVHVEPRVEYETGRDLGDESGR